VRCASSSMINLKTAKALEITVPPSLRARAPRAVRT
jgi:hypothetical protein